MGMFQGKKLKYRLQLHMRSGKTTHLPVCEEYHVAFDRSLGKLTEIKITGIVDAREGDAHAILETIGLADIEFIAVEYV